MAVPKKRTTNSSKGQRRSHHALIVANVMKCTNCAKPIRSHVVCANCGFYKGKLVAKV